VLMKHAVPPVAVPTQPREMLDEREAARYLTLSPAFLRKRRRLGRPPAYAKLGRRIVYDRSDLDTLITAGRVSPSPRVSS